MMIKTQIIKEDNRPVAVIVDYNEYLKMKDIQENKLDYDSAAKVKRTNKSWTGHNDLKAELGI
ncbi:MAG: hypothetical protein ABIH39_05265 [Candidatus Margulisiibacteriota bacterium]